MRWKYAASFKNGMKEQLSEKMQLFGNFFRYALAIYLFFQVFDSVEAPSSQYLYFSLTQVITIATPLLALQISEEIQRGDLLPFLLRPIWYPGYRLATAMGKTLVCYGSLIGFYIALTIYLGGEWTMRTFIALLLVIGSIAISLLLSMIIGLLSAWLGDIKSIFWLHFTTTFALGGLIVPIHDYPSWMQTLIFLTPYPWILYAPAAYSINAPLSLPSICLAYGIWASLAIATLSFLYRRCIKTFVTGNV